MTLPTTGIEVLLARRPQGWPELSDFSVLKAEVPPPGEGELVVRNLFCSVDPYMRGRMNDVKSYVPPFVVGEVLEGGALGEVLASRSPTFSEGDLVTHGLGWREYAVAGADRFSRLVPADGIAPTAYLGVLGGTGLTAYVGLLDVAELTPADVVFVSGAAGAVGSIAGQIAKLRGAPRVIGSAGSDAKVTWLTAEAGFDDAINYKRQNILEALPALAGERGIDVYFDNVGGDHLDAALDTLNPFGRVALCGAISQYNVAGTWTGPANLRFAIGKRLTLRGFIVSDYGARTEAFRAEVGAAILDGRLKVAETVVDGIENMPQAFLDLLAGVNTGKMLVRVAL